MYSRLKRKITITVFVLLGLLSVLCTQKPEPEPEEIILARVGTKTISLNEFIRRAEYTVRPKYCMGDGNIQKKIILNSLIAEKMLALETGDNNELNQNERYQRYIQGRKEQAMRQWLFSKEGVEKVKLDSTDIKAVYRIAGRKYKLQFLNVDSDSIASAIKQKLQKEGEPFEEVYREFTGLDSIPQREVEYNSQQAEVIRMALFSKKRKVDEVIGPLKIEDDYNIFIKIKGWTDRIAVTEIDIKQRWNDVSERLSEQKSLQIYQNYIAKVMKGKKIDFAKNTFHKVVNLIAPLYFQTAKPGKELFLNRAFNKELDNLEIADFKKGIEGLRDATFFQVDGKVWTVRDFENELNKHPLVFRKKRFTSNEFGKQFKLAVVDLVRDRYLTEEAYKRGYDKVNVIKRNVEMWQDASLALYQKSEYLKSIISYKENGMNTITKYLNPYINSLQEKYNDEIEVNVDEFNKIQLTRIDMFALQENVPFPIMVPAFPQVTTDHKLNYGRKM
ncbi:MAG: hypothetical protein IMY71_08000 [Bacteroidetes bacterium]|nr:hypothetical protein [Bacteroidota bacterium]